MRCKFALKLAHHQILPRPVDCRRNFDCIPPRLLNYHRLVIGGYNLVSKHRQSPAMLLTGAAVLRAAEVRYTYLYNCTNTLESRNGHSHRHVGDTSCRGPRTRTSGADSPYQGRNSGVSVVGALGSWKR